MKTKQKDHFNPNRERKLRTVLFTLILLGAVFVGMMGNVIATVFDPPHSDYAEDTDGDGYYNYLVVNVVVNVDVPGNYIIDGSLADSIGEIIDSTINSTYLDAGVQVVQLRFEGWLIHKNGVNGPYTVYLDLYDGSWILLDSDVYTTNLYKYDDFELPPAVFLLPYSDYGLDTDGDNYFNYLVVNITIDVTVAGIYEVEGDLIDDILNWIDTISNITFFSVGTQGIQLYFDGMSIYRNGRDGPYTINLNLYDNSSNTVDTDSYTTNFYTFDQFQAPGVSFKPPHSDYGLDTDGDGYFNYLVVNVTVEVIVSGFYRIDGDLLNDTPKWIDNDTNYTFLNVGTHVVQLYFSGVSIYNKEGDGPYTVELDVFDDFAVWLDSDTYLTNFYSNVQFQPPPAVFDPPYSDYGLDTNGDGFFNYLVVNITLNVDVAGYYKVDGSLSDSYFDFIESVDNLTFLNTGVQVVQLYFKGSVINNHGVNGVFIVILDLFDSLSNSIDSDIYVTGSYMFNQFQPPSPPSPPTGLQASLINGGNDVMLSWNASADDGTGENDVEGYTVYKSSAGINGIYDFAAWIKATGSLSYNWIDVNAGDGDWNDYFYIIRANDTLNMEEKNTNKVGKIVNYLQDGWNLISLPLIQIDTSKEYVLQTLDSNYLTIQRYHAGKSRPWMHWHRGKPSHFNDPMEINHQEGYYIDMLISDHLVMAGKVPSITQISLKTGWNLVSYPSLINKTVSDVLSSIAGKYNVVYYYDTVKDREVKMSSSDYMQLGSGYWIHAKENCVWEI